MPSSLPGVLVVAMITIVLMTTCVATQEETALPAPRRLSAAPAEPSVASTLSEAARLWGAAAESIAYVLGVDGAVGAHDDRPHSASRLSERLSQWVMGDGSEKKRSASSLKLPAGVVSDATAAEHNTAEDVSHAAASRRFLAMTVGGGGSTLDDEYGSLRWSGAEDGDEESTADSAAHRKRRALHVQSIVGRRPSRAASSTAEYDPAPGFLWTGGSTTQRILEDAAAADKRRHSAHDGLTSRKELHLRGGFSAQQATNATTPTTTAAPSDPFKGITFFCDNGVVAVPTAANFTCRNQSNATYNLTGLEFAALPSQEAKRNCTPLTSLRQCICGLDSMITTDTNGWVFCAARPTACSARLESPVPNIDNVTAPELPFRVPAVSVASRSATVTLRLLTNCSFTPVDVAGYAFYGWFFIAPPGGNQSFVVWRTGILTQAVINDTTTYNSVGTYANLSSRAFRYIENISDPFPASIDHYFGVSNISAKAYNFWVLSDNSGQLASATVVGGGQLNGKRTTNISVDFDTIPDRFLVAKRMYLEAGIRTDAYATWSTSARISFDFAAAIVGGSPITQGLRRTLVDIVVPVVVAVAVVVLAVVAVVVYRLRRKKKAE